MPAQLNANQLVNVAKGIIYQGLNPQYFNFIQNYWDIIQIDSDNIHFSELFAQGGSGDAIQVRYIWSQWKWIAIPNPDYWVAINYDEGITSLLNP